MMHDKLKTVQKMVDKKAREIAKERLNVFCSQVLVSLESLLGKSTMSRSDEGLKELFAATIKIMQRTQSEKNNLVYDADIDNFPDIVLDTIRTEVAEKVLKTAIG